MPDPGRDVTASQEVTGLHPSTRYGFTVFSTNLYGSSEKVALNVATAEAATVTCSNAGLMTAVVLAVCLLTVIVLVFLCRRRVLPKSRHLKGEMRGNTTPPGVTELSSAASGPYNELDHVHSDNQTYSELQTGGK